MIRHIEQRLLLVIEVTGDDQGARLFQPEAALRVIEAASDGEGGGSQNRGVDFVPKVLTEQAGNIDGGCLEKHTVAAAAVDPVNVGRVGAFDEEMQRLTEFLRAPEERNHFLR